MLTVNGMHCRPQHHRPSTFMPCDTHIERDEATGAVTVWCSEHEPMSRMKVPAVYALQCAVHVLLHAHLAACLL